MATTSIPRSMPRTPTTRLSRNPAAAWRHLDLVLVGAVLSIAGLGTLMVYSATRGPTAPYKTSLFLRQGAFVGIGSVLLVLVSLVDYRVFRDWALAIYIGASALLVLVVSPVGSSSKGAQAWFQIGGFQMQPSEFAKLGTIFALAALASQFRNEIDLRRLVALIVLAAVPLGLILLQPDLGTGLVLIAITAGVLVVAGVPSRYLLAVMLIGVLGTTFVLRSDMLAQYQKDRLTSFLDQNQNLRRETYNLNQSKTAIGNGGTFGQGLFQGPQTRLGNVPEQHTDFIFTAVGEQLGFAGAATLLALFCIVAWRIWRAAQLARDPFGTLVCVGVLCLFMFQIFENVGMTMGIMPVTGIPLPFVSYGGSSTLAEFAAIGVVLNIHMRRFA
jgi:rod shape determining protein RodA